MKTLITIIAILTLAGCASRAEKFEDHAVIMAKIDAVYCEGSGFTFFQDLGRYWSMKCSNGSKFIVKKD